MKIEEHLLREILSKLDLILHHTKQPCNFEENNFKTKCEKCGVDFSNVTDYVCADLDCPMYVYTTLKTSNSCDPWHGC